MAKISAPVSAPVTAPVPTIAAPVTAPVTAPAPVPTIAAPVVNTAIGLTRSQRKAFDYAQKMQNEGRAGDLVASSNRLERELGRDLYLQNRNIHARGNNKAILQLIIDINGGNSRVPTPQSASTADLCQWVADVDAIIRGKADSTAKARATRDAYVTAHYGSVLVMIGELSRKAIK